MGGSENRRLHQAVLGLASPQEVRGWLDRHVRDHLHTVIESVMFQAGDVDAVFGLRLTGGRYVVLKALRGAAVLDRARAVVRCQSLLARRGFSCPKVIDGPSVTDGVTVIVEDRMWCSPTGDPHQPAVRR